MKMIAKLSELTGMLLTALAILVLTSSAFAADALRIQPTRQDFGTVEEGVPAIMLSIVENISSQEVHISNVRTN
ncbi:MAG: hypothetical protein WCJ37_08380 [Syntrophus sp. (in: bacteria)]